MTRVQVCYSAFMLSAVVLGRLYYQESFVTWPFFPSPGGRGLKVRDLLQRITQQLAAEKGVTKGIARRAASSFAALITEAGLGTCSGENKARVITWVKSAQEIASRSLDLGAIKARVESTPLSVVRNDQPPADSNGQGSNGREGEKNYTIVQHQQNIGHLAVRPGYLGVVADMTNWTESQIQTFWTGHNGALELMRQIAREGGDRG